MPVCEQCQVTFETPATSAGEVTSLRILCPACTAERQKRKQAEAAARVPGSASTAARPAAATRPPAATPGAAPAAARPTTAPGAAPAAARPTTAPGAAPAAARTVAPAPGAAKPASAPATAKPAAAVAAAPGSTSHSVPSAPAPSTPAMPSIVSQILPGGPETPVVPVVTRISSPPAPAAKAASPGSAAPKPAKRAAPAAAAGRRASLRPQGAPSRTYEVVDAGAEKPVLDKATKIGLFCALGLAVCAGIVVVLVQAKKASDKAAYDERVRLEQEFLDELHKLDLKDPAQAALARPLAEKNRARWESRDSAMDVNTILARADAVQKNEEDRKAFATRLDGISAQLAAESTMTAVQIAELRRTLGSMLSSSREFGPESEARVKATQADASRAFLNRLLDEGRKFATEHPDEPVAALKKLALAEEEARKQISVAMVAKDEGTKNKLDPVYRAVVAEQDTLAEKTFTEAYIANVAWRDLISPAEQGKWLLAKMKGFTTQFLPTGLILQGPDPDTKGQALISIGDQEKWRDFVLEFDFRLKTGAPTFYFRLGDKPDPSVESIQFEASDESGIPASIDPSKTYHITVHFIGSHLTIKPLEAEEDDIKTTDVLSGVYKSRFGALGIAIPKGCRLEIVKLRIKALR